MKKAHGKKMFTVFFLVLAVVLSGSAALADFYVISVGKRAKRTVLVSPQSTPAASGTALLNALNGITDASESNPYLIIIEPGVYDIGGNTLQMKPYVDIQGSGENLTRITGNITGPIDGHRVAVVKGTGHADLRFLTVENTGGGNEAVAISLSWDSEMTNVTANAREGTYNYGVYNNGGTMTNVTIYASHGTYSYGVYNYGVDPTMTNVTAKVWGDGLYNYGVYNERSYGTMTDVTATASGGTESYGVYNERSSPTMTDVTATASRGTYNYGVYNHSSDPTMTGVTATASEGRYKYGVRNFYSSPTMTNMTAAASGGYGGWLSVGVYNENYSHPTMTNVTVTASEGAVSVGVYNEATAKVKIDHSGISAVTNTVYNEESSEAFVGNTRLEGGAVGGHGDMTCAGVYDEHYTFYPDSCP